jgi:predicted O-methyltransferase YrrM
MKSLAHDPQAQQVLQKLYQDARADIWRFVAMAPGFLMEAVRGQSASAKVKAARFRTAYIPIGPAGGDLLYLTARAGSARQIVEFGTSFGISTIYLAAAVRDNGGGSVTTTELSAEKMDRAKAHIQAAGLTEFVTFLEGDAQATLPGSPLFLQKGLAVDLLFLDGWKELYLPVLDLVQPRLRAGAWVLADNVTMYKKTLAPYVRRMQCGGDFSSTTLPFGAGIEASIFTPRLP